MYCGNCGKEIENGVAFCPVCGSSVGEGKARKVDSKKAGKVIVIVSMIAVVVIIATVGLEFYSYLHSISTGQQLQLAVNNYQNGGIVATDDKWLYYNDNGLCKIRLKDGSKQTVVSDDIMPKKMFYAGDSLFYYRFPGIYKTQGNSGKEIDLEFSVFTENCFQTDGKNYYLQDRGMQMLAYTPLRLAIRRKQNRYRTSTLPNY